MSALKGETLRGGENQWCFDWIRHQNISEKSRGGKKSVESNVASREIPGERRDRGAVGKQIKGITLGAKRTGKGTPMEIRAWEGIRVSAQRKDDLKKIRSGENRIEGRRWRKLDICGGGEE